MVNLKNINILFIKKERIQLLILFIGMLFVGFMEVAGIASIAPFLAVVTDPSIIHSNSYLSVIYKELGFSSEKSFIIGSGVLFICVLVISGASNLGMNWYISRFVHITEARLSQFLFKKYLSKPYIFFLDRHSSEMSKNILVEVNRVIAEIIFPFLHALAKLVIMILLFTLLILVEPKIAVSVAFIISLSYICIYKLVKTRLVRIGSAHTMTIAQRYKVISEAFSGIKELKLMRRELRYFDRFVTPSNDHAKYVVQTALISETPKFILEVVSFGLIVSVIIFLVNSGKDNSEVIALVALYGLAGYRLMPSAQLIYKNATIIKFNWKALELMIRELNTGDDDTITIEKNSEPLPFISQLKLNDISFSYPNTESSVLKNMNLVIKPQTTVALVGITGSGKTTLIDIILGLLSPNSGNISVGDTNITEENIRKWQANLSYVPQSIYLLDGTIEQNIAFTINDHEIDTEKILLACVAAELQEFVDSLPDKLHTQVGERGVRLSGGQRQRIGIARAIYNKSKLIILDEATSALDGITEKKIIDSMHRLSKNLTVIMIAHRITTIQSCDSIHMLEHGRIIASGTYDELMKNEKKFRMMASVTEE